MTGTTMLLGAGLLLMATGTAEARSAAPPDSMPLSQIIKNVEGRNVGVITDIEFDDGLWEVDVHQDTAETTLYLDPATGQAKRQERGRDVEDELPPRDGKPLSELIKSIEDQKAGVITDVEFDDGFWEVTVRKDGKKVKMDIDPKTGERREGARG